MIEYIDWGIIPYDQAWKKQTEYFDSIIKAKQEGRFYKNRILFCQHPHVYTLGKNGKINNILLSEEEIKQKELTFCQVDRGGDITYHGPGQLVCYPILNLEEFNLGLKEYISLLEEAVISVCGLYGIKTGRLKDAVGIWTDNEKLYPKKICAIGVKSSKYVTMHGLALNVNTELKYFDYINPCGFKDKGVISMREKLDYEININEVMEHLKKQFEYLLG